MSLSIRRTALVDTGYWYALLDRRDQCHAQATSKAETLWQLRYLIPWPVMYETLCTRFARRPLSVRQFELFLKRPNAVHLDDRKYRDAALSLTLDTRKPHPTTISMVDSVLRLALDDRVNRIDCMFTFNTRDFRDICVRRNIQML